MGLKEDLEAANTVAWIIGQAFVTENRKPFEFFDHRFLLTYLADDHRHKVSKKSSQIGETVGELFDDFHLAIHRKMNVIHTLHNNDVLGGFVQPKVDPIILHNRAISSHMSINSKGLKQFGDNFVYFRGANSESQAINISADVLKIDEKDRSDPHVVEMFESRLDFSKYKWIREFSNPSAVGFGVDATYNRSDQRHWMVWCHRCNHVSYMDFEPSEDLNHYVHKELKIYACGKCHKELSTADRVNGEWVARFPSNDKIHGYWFSQMMAPWFEAAEIVDKYENNSIEYFHNFVLGKAFTPQDMIVDREAILRACAPSTIPRMQVAIGVDQDAGGQYYVCMTPLGIFEHGYVDAWEKIEQLKLMYNALVVCDPNPYSAIPKQMAAKYNDWYLCYFKNLDGLSAIKWKEQEQVVYADRTRVIDIRANEIVNGRLLYREHPYKLEDVIKHWTNLYRTTIEEDDGRSKSTWIKQDGKQSDYPFAEVYARIGLSQLLGGGNELIEPTREPDAKVTNITTNDGSTLTVDFSGILADTMAEFDE